MITCIPIYPHGISRNICTPKEAAWGRCGWYCSLVWPCSLASRWIRQTWRRRGQKKQGWHLAFKSVFFCFINFHDISLKSTKCKSQGLLAKWTKHARRKHDLSPAVGGENWMQRLLRVRPVCLALFCQVSSLADVYRLKAQAEEAQRIMQAEYKSKQSHLNSLHPSRIKEVHTLYTQISFRHCSLVQIHFCFCNPQQVHYGIQEADEEQFQIFSDAVSIFFVLSEVIPALVGWCSSEATTCKYIMMHHVVLWHFMWNKLISSWQRLTCLSTEFSESFCTMLLYIFFSSQQLEEIRKLLEEISQAEIAAISQNLFTFPNFMLTVFFCRCFWRPRQKRQFQPKQWQKSLKRRWFQVRNLSKGTCRCYELMN